MDLVCWVEQKHRTFTKWHHHTLFSADCFNFVLVPCVVFYRLLLVSFLWKFFFYCLVP
jgi:hypothetical protein